jgi:dolichyl-diphosphooligosaccharide--protein glycosyltransferase
MERVLHMSFGKIKRSTGRFLRQVFHRPKAKISRGSVLIIVTLIITFTTALLLRLEPLINSQPIVRAFDPWFQLRVTDYITDHGFNAFFTWYDHATWVPFGRDMAKSSYIGVPFTSAFFYFLLNGLGIQVDVITVSLVLPAFMGALTVVVAFFLGRELSNTTVGLFTAIFTAFIPAYIQRTIAGFYDNEFIGVFAIVLTTFLFMRGLKRGSLFASVGAGLSLSYLLVSWGGSDFMLGLLALYGFLMLLIGHYSKNLLSSYLITISIGIFIGELIPRNGFDNLTSFTILAPIGVGGLLVLYEIWLRVSHYREATANVFAPYMKPILLGIITPVVGVVSYLLYMGSTELTISPYTSNPIVTLGSKFITVLNPFTRLDQRILASVAEHLPSPWGSFYNNLLILIFFFPLGMYFLFKRGRDEDWFILLYGLFSVYFAGSMIRLALILGPGAAVLAAVASYNILAPYAKVVTQQSVFERRRFRMSSSLTSEHSLTAFAFIGLLLSVNVILGVQYVQTQVGYPEFSSTPLSTANQYPSTDWQVAMTYIRNVLPSGSIIASWWDYGYWINSGSGAETIVDNATFNFTQIALMGYALMALNLTESLKTFKLWNTTHVLVYWGHRYSAFGGDDGKWPWMVRIAEDMLGSKKIDDAIYLGANDETLEAFYSSTLYKLLSYGEPKDQTEADALGLSSIRIEVDKLFWQDTAWTDHMPVDLHGAFKDPFISSAYGTVKIYEIDYTMYYQYMNQTKADWIPGFTSGNLGVSLDGALSSAELALPSRTTTFGGSYEAQVYTQANSTHMYYGIKMDNYSLGADAFGIQISPEGSPQDSDIRIVNYNGGPYDGHIKYDGTWAEDSTGTNSTEFATGNNVIEFIVPLHSSDPQDVALFPGMNYQLRFLWWNNIDHGDPTFSSPWRVFWVPVQLY